MNRTLTFFAVLTAAFLMAVPPVHAAEPDKPGTKLITVQGGYGPGIGAIVSGNIAMANLGAAHLYGGIQFGANFRHGAVTETKKTDLSAAPRLMLGFNLGRVVELHFGGLAGIAAQRFDARESNLAFCWGGFGGLAGISAQRFDARESNLAFCWGGFGGLRLNLSDSFALLAEGYYSPMLPYGSAGIAFRF